MKLAKVKEKLTCQPQKIQESGHLEGNNGRSNEQ